MMPNFLITFELGSCLIMGTAIILHSKCKIDELRDSLLYIPGESVVVFAVPNSHS